MEGKFAGEKRGKVWMSGGRSAGLRRLPPRIYEWGGGDGE